MLRNYFKTAFRNLLRNRSQALINITGLVVGIAACLLIFLVLQYEQSFDSFHTKKDRIFRVVRVGKESVNREYRTGVPFPVTNGLRADYPQLENAASICGAGTPLVLIPGDKDGTVKKFKENGAFFAEPRFFQLFDFKALMGNPASAIAEPNTAMLTKTTAEKYFGDWRTAIGKTIKLDNQEVKITGILDNPPVNTDFPLKIMISYATLAKQVDMNNWIGISDDNYCFVLLRAPDQADHFNSLLPAFMTKHFPPDHSGYNLRLQPLLEIHYDGRYGNFNGRTFSKDLIKALSLLGLFLLIIACVNFINLSTAQAINRAREVGVRKVLGGNRRQLQLQFLGETGLTCLIALILSAIVALITLPLLNGLLETQLSFNLLQNHDILLFMIAVFFAVTFLSGFYPALVLSGFNPILALKSRITAQSTGGISLRRGLVVFQFVIAQVLLIGTLVIVSQLDYFKNADLGFNKTAIVNVPFPGDSLSRSKDDMVRNELIRQPGIREVSFSRSGPTGGNDTYTDLRLSNNHTKKADLIVGLKIADTAYFGIYKLQLAAGRLYFPSDTIKEFLVNETLLQALSLGTPREAIGKKINVFGRTLPIVGVIKDFHVNSLRDLIRPMVMTTMKGAYGMANIQLQPGKTKATLAAIESLWNKSYPDYVFEYSFVDQSVADYYKQETRLTDLYNIFSGIAIFISCLGLYGLISFMAVRRNKEIGVRKVLGASIPNIVFLLTREFTFLIALAFLIACPIGWYFMHQWLQQYSFRIDLGAGFFILTILSSLVIAWLSVGYSAIRAAMANPVKSLRTE